MSGPSNGRREGGDAGTYGMSTGRPSRFDPLLHLGQVPGDISAGERDATWEFPSLLHVENRALGKRDHRQKCLAIDEGLVLHVAMHTVAFTRLRMQMI